MVRCLPRVADRCHHRAGKPTARRSPVVVSRSPQAPDRVLVETPDADEAAVAAAATRAGEAGREWERAGGLSRAQALAAAGERIANASEEFTALMVDEVGKPVTEARGEAARAVAILRYFAQQAIDPDGETLPSANPRALLYMRRRPHGVAGLITPWNFPLAIPLWKAAPALAFGNAVLLKPAPEATALALRLGELLSAVLPDGLFHVLPGDVEAGRAVVDNADAVSFTGSVAAGGSVAAAAAGRGVPVQAEMGGLNASIVLPDADLDSAMQQVAFAAMGYAGQKCTATSRVIAVGNEARAAEVTDALVAAVGGQRLGDPGEAETAVGPVIEEAARDAVVAAAQRAAADGARVLVGGRAPDRSGWYVEPTVVTNAPAGSQLVTEEVFGPITAVQSAPDASAAVRLNNAVRYGLVTSVYTRDLDAALGLVSELDTGLVRVNAPTSGVDFWAPFGGEKSSSYGPREQGKAAREFYTSTRTFMINPAG
ncbi:MAG: aldehyde dehydrogenase family protein [Streptosporangiales bacterium]|nr:aldehyde dehydrogenase family protein [Streptosporangiales bacterium]